jgi:hypothetical protein
VTRLARKRHTVTPGGARTIGVPCSRAKIARSVANKSLFPVTSHFGVDPSIILVYALDFSFRGRVRLESSVGSETLKLRFHPFQIRDRVVAFEHL